MHPNPESEHPRLIRPPMHVAAFDADESGMVSWATLIAVLLILLLANLVLNVGATFSTKMETQTAADAVAYSCAVTKARQMNAVTAVNHVMGELTALMVLHHAIGGRELDDDKNTDSDWQTLLDINYAVACVCATDEPDEDQYETVSADILGGATLFDGKDQLKMLMSKFYFSHAVGGLLVQTNVPVLVAVGEALIGVCKGMEAKIAQEYELLDMFESVATSLLDAKKHIPDALDALWLYEQGLVGTEGVPGLCAVAVSATAQAAGEANHVQGYVQFDGLPIVEDPAEEAEQSQLMRATYPWVHYWRRPILVILHYGATLSGAGHAYENFSNDYSKSIVHELRCGDNGSAEELDQTHAIRLHVMQETHATGVEKGEESWFDDSAQAEELFTILAVARKEQVRLRAPSFFTHANPRGIACAAQAMIYNANPRVAGSRSKQPRVGWDTLAWVDGHAVEYARDGEYGPFPPLPDGKRPKIRLNWQARLTPVTDSKIDAAWSLSPLLRPRMSSRHFELNTH